MACFASQYALSQTQLLVSYSGREQGAGRQSCPLAPLIARRIYDELVVDIMGCPIRMLPSRIPTMTTNS